MTSDTDDRITADQGRPPIWRNGTFLKWAAQIVVLATLLVAAWIVISTALRNLEAQGLSFDWDFLGDPVGFSIGEGFTQQPETGLEALLVGAVNSLRVIGVGLLLALVLGVVMGIARLSSNWLVNRTAQIYVESIRNVPLLLQMIFWNVIFISFAPLDPANLGPIEDWFLVSAKGVSFAFIFGTETVWQWLVFFVLALWVGRIVYKRRFDRFEETGHETRPILFGLLAVVAVAIIGWFAHPVAGAFEWVFHGIATALDAVPPIGWSIVIAVAAVLLGAWWIRRFLNSFRTPAGMAKLTDDDWFRVAFAGVVAVGVAAFVLFFPGVIEAGQNVIVGLFDWIGDRYEWLRTGAPLDFRQPGVTGDRFP